MAKIYVIGDNPMTSPNIGYLSWDGCREIKLKYKELPFVREVEAGTHELYVTTQSSFSRNLSKSSGGGALNAFSKSLNNSYNDTWLGTVTLESDDVLFIYIEFGFKNKIYPAVFKENELDEKTDEFFAHLSSEKKKSIIKKIILFSLIAVIVVAVGVSVSNQFRVNRQGFNKIPDKNSTQTDKESKPSKDAADEKENKSESKVGKYVCFKGETNIYDNKNFGAVIATGYVNQIPLVLEESENGYKIKIPCYREKKAYIGWCKKSDVTDFTAKSTFSAEVPLDLETAKKMFLYYYDLPYYAFEELNMLNFDDCYIVREGDEGRIAAYAYSVDGINNHKDLIDFYSGFCTGTLLKEKEKRDIDNYASVFVQNGKLYFTGTYASGSNQTFGDKLEKISDKEYRLTVIPGFVSVEGDLSNPSRDFYKIIVEDGKYKLSEVTRNYEW